MRKYFYMGVRVLLLFLVMSQGCATFQSTKTINMAPFSETMLNLVGDIQFGIEGKQWVYLKPYLNSPKVLKAVDGIIRMRELMRGIVFYSIQVVSINNSNLPENSKCEMLGQYLDLALSPSLIDQERKGKYDISIDPDTLDKVVSEIKEQKSFLDGLSKAQPLIDAVVGYSDGFFNNLKADVKDATNEISEKIDSDFSAIKNNIYDMEELQKRTINSYWLLNNYRFSEGSALDSLLKYNPEFEHYISPGKSISKEQFSLMEEELMKRMDNISFIKQQLTPEFELYKAQQKELDEISGFVNDMMRKSRIAMIVFARSHRNLAAGVTIPPEIDILGEAGKVVGKIIP